MLIWGISLWNNLFIHQYGLKADDKSVISLTWQLSRRGGNSSRFTELGRAASSFIGGRVESSPSSTFSSFIRECWQCWGWGKQFSSYKSFWFWQDRCLVVCNDWSLQFQYQIWRKAIGAHVRRMNQNSVYINQWNLYNIGYYKKIC